MSCTLCSKLVSEQLVVCQGFCSSTFHRTCIGLSVEDFVCWNRNTLIWWMCSACSQMMDCIRRSESMLAEREKYESQPQCYKHATESAIEIDRSKPTMQDVMHEIAMVKQQISEIQVNISAGLATAHEHVLESSVVTQTSPLSSTRLLHGSRLDPSDDSSSGSDIGDRFWLFFTRIRNTVTEEQMLDMVCESLNCTSSAPPVVKKLVPCWKDESSMPYISFKIGIDPILKTTALLPSTWPKNICFREFYDRLRIWEPNRQR